MKKHETLEAAAQLGSADEITAALRDNENVVDQMISLQELGLEVLPIQGGQPVEQPWLVDPDEKRWEKIPAGRPLTDSEWKKKDEEEAERVGEEAPLARRHTYKKDGTRKNWWSYGKDHPLEYYAEEIALDYLDSRYHAAGVLFQDGLIGVDADTPEEVAFLRKWWQEHTGKRTIPWTVRTPGRVSEGSDGEPVREHSEGGHLWIRMPEGWAKTLPGHAKDRISVGDGVSRFDVKRGGGYFITPHSTRSEGEYQLRGRVVDATTDEMGTLVEALLKAFTPAPRVEPKKATFFSAGSTDTIERIQQWSEQRSWLSILTDLGWKTQPAGCGERCLEFFYPGSSSGQHSGIAHEESCGSAPVPGAIHFYSSTAMDALNLQTGTLKKYRFVLEQMYGGSTEAFFQQEPVKDTSWKKSEPQNSKEVKKKEALQLDANVGTQEASVEATEEVADEATQEASVEATQEASDEGTQEASVEATQEGSVEATQEASDEGTQEASVEATQEGSVEATQEASVEGTQEVSDEGTHEVSDEGTEEVTDEGTQEVSDDGDEETVIVAEVSADSEGDAEETSALEKWHTHLATARAKFRFYITEEGSKAWAYAHSPSVVTIGSAGDLTSEMRNLYGDEALPLKKDKAEAIVDRIFLDLRKSVMKGEVSPVKRVSRFYTCPKTGHSWVYTAAPDTEARMPFIKITERGSERAEAPEGVVFDSSGELGVLEVDTSGTIEDFWKALDLVNIPKKDRLLILGWLMTPVHATDSARPGILLRGGAGSGKTSTAIRLKEIIDPDQGLTSESLAPTGEKNAFLASLRGSDTKIPGNLSGLSGTMSDAISQSMTGARYERDEKYTENKLSWTIKCSMIFSTINTGMVLQGDIQSRLFPIDVPEIPEQLRALGDIIEGQWVDILPRARGGLFKLISEVKAKIKVSEDLPVFGFRMIPAAKAMSAAELVLDDHGIEYTPWGDVYGEAITGLQRDALPAEIDFILNDLSARVSGRPGEILKALHEEAEQNGFSTRDWSIKNARSFSSRLEENRDLLETKVKVTKEKIPGRGNTIRWTLDPVAASGSVRDYIDPLM